MSSRKVSSIRVPVVGRASYLEIEIIESAPPKQWRIRIAMMLIKLAGRFAAMRVRVNTDVSRETEWHRNS